MPRWLFRWMQLTPRDIKITIFRYAFTGPNSASKDVCKSPNCGITREHHVKLDHHFLEA